MGERTFADFKASVKSRAWPVGVAENLEATIDKMIVEGLIQVQRYVRCYQATHKDVATTDAGTYSACGITYLKNPRGKVLKVTNRLKESVMPAECDAAARVGNTEQSFTAECGDGFSGEPVAVTIPAGVYLAATQAEADALALAAATEQAQAALVCEETPSQYFSPYLYFPFDEEDTTWMYDVVQNLYLTYINGAIVSEAGKISNGWRFGDGSTHYGQYEAADFDIDFADEDWCIRVWVKPGGLSPGNEPFWSTVPTGNDGFIAFFRTADNHIKIRVWHGGSFQDYDFETAGGIPNDGDWHRLVMWRQGATLGVKIDNGTSETQAMPHTVGSWETFIWGPPIGLTYNHSFDELAIWRGYVPTEAELLHDWNGGAGRTLPLT